MEAVSSSLRQGAGIAPRAPSARRRLPLQAPRLQAPCTAGRGGEMCDEKFVEARHPTLYSLADQREHCTFAGMPTGNGNHCVSRVEVAHQCGAAGANRFGRSADEDEASTPRLGTPRHDDPNDLGVYRDRGQAVIATGVHVIDGGSGAGVGHRSNQHLPTCGFAGTAQIHRRKQHLPSSLPEPMLDRVPGETERQRLPARDDEVLGADHMRERRVDEGEFRHPCRLAELGLGGSDAFPDCGWPSDPALAG
jgi:hypothetical protein